MKLSVIPNPLQRIGLCDRVHNNPFTKPITAIYPLPVHRDVVLGRHARRFAIQNGNERRFTAMSAFSLRVLPSWSNLPHQDGSATPAVQLRADSTASTA